MRYGFIGCGNMGGAVARAVCRGVGPENVVLANRTPAKAEDLDTAGGGEDRPLPLHKIVQIAVQFHDFLARAQPQVAHQLCP